MSEPNNGFSGAVPDDSTASPAPPPRAGLPRVAPPEGVRAARGQNFDEPSPETVAAPKDAEIALDELGEAPLLPPASPPILGENWDSDAVEKASEAEFIERSERDESIEAQSEDDERFRVSPLRDDTPHDKELGLIEHLTELRQRLLYSFLAVGLGMCFTFFYSKQLQTWFAEPINQILKTTSTKPGELVRNQLISTDPMGFFYVTFTFSLISALILTMPFIFFQAWRFIEPALTNSERRYTLILVPFSSVLFFLGAGLGYFVSPLFFAFFLQFQPENVVATWDYNRSLILMAKMLLVFGVMFQVPVVVIFGAKVGLLTRDLLIQYWRHAVIVIFVICAILTPTWDPLTLLACAVPPCLLYALSIWLVKWL